MPQRELCVIKLLAALSTTWLFPTFLGPWSIVIPLKICSAVTSASSVGWEFSSTVSGSKNVIAEVGFGGKERSCFGTAKKPAFLPHWMNSSYPRALLTKFRKKTEGRSMSSIWTAVRSNSASATLSKSSAIFWRSQDGAAWRRKLLATEKRSTDAPKMYSR